MMNGFSERTQEEDESQILASLGSTAASASAYEQSVLRDAKLKSAPQIVLPHSTIAANIVDISTRHHASTSLVPCGGEQPTFPDLSTLAPSTASSSRKKRDAHADVPHVLKVLSRTRHQLQSALSSSNQIHDGGSGEISENEQKQRREIDMLSMKEQILLSYLIDVVGLKADDAVIPQRKFGNRTKRLHTNNDTGDEYYGTSRSQDVIGEKNDADLHLKEATAGSQTQPSSTIRLDRIKNGETVDTLEKRPLKRNTMMRMKSRMRIESGLTPLKTMDEERFDEEKSRKRRDDRKKRRLQRQRAELGMGYSREEENEAQFDMKPPGILRRKNDDAIDSSQDTQNENDDEKKTMNGVHWAKQNKSSTQASSPDAKKRTHTKVYCPICQLTLSANSGSEGGELPDEFLAKHITECQSSTRNGRRSQRNRKKPGVSYVDEGEAEEFNTDEPDAMNGDSNVDSEDTYESKKPPHQRNDDMYEFDYEERIDDWIECGLDRMKNMSERDQTESPPGTVVYEGGLEIPAWINNRLFPYQRAGVRWMWELHCQGVGGVVGDEMGLGKTVQVSSFLGAMASNRIIDSVLIVAPATMLSHWLRELEVWAPGLRRILIHRSGESDGVSRVISSGMLRSLRKWLRNAREDRVNEAIDENDYNQNEEHSFCGTGYAIVTTYESIRRSTDEWINHSWSYVVLDEGQKIKNPDADITLASKRLRTPHRLLLSGTPIQNDLRELWSLFDFIIPGRLGTLPAFEAEFSDPIKRGGYSNATPMQVQLAYRCALVLRDLINPYLLRRQKKDVTEVSRMPGKTEQVLFCRLSPKQRSLYEEYLRSGEVTGVMRGGGRLLKAVTVLRKICNHTDLIFGRNGVFASDDGSVSSSDDDYDHNMIGDQSGKLQVLSKILPLWKKQGHKVIIFTQWRKMLSIIEQFVIHQDWKYARLDGNTNIAARQRLVDKFNNDESYFCMLMTTRTGGVGLNITGANRVLLYDPDFNPSTDAQARERAWRFGQTKEVTVYRLITAGTIEEKIYQRQIFKTALTNQILQDPKQRRLFSQNDLRDLFTLKADSNVVTETGEITKGGGVLEMNTPSDHNQEENIEEQPCDNNNTLEVVMKSKGICGIFDHDFVEPSSINKKPPSVVEMEENARKIAMKAAIALQASSQNQTSFEPTWTGSDETRPLERGENRMMSSSSSLIANLQNRRLQIASNSKFKSASQGSSHNVETEKYSGLLLRMKNYIRRTTNTNGNGPTTRELLAEFKDVPNSDAAVFRSMLRSIAEIKNGKWVLHE